MYRLFYSASAYLFLLMVSCILFNACKEKQVEPVEPEGEYIRGCFGNVGLDFREPYYTQAGEVNHLSNAYLVANPYVANMPLVQLYRNDSKQPTRSIKITLLYASLDTMHLPYEFSGVDKGLANVFLMNNIDQQVDSLSMKFPHSLPKNTYYGSSYENPLLKIKLLSFTDDILHGTFEGKMIHWQTDELIDVTNGEFRIKVVRK